MSVTIRESKKSYPLHSLSKQLKQLKQPTERMENEKRFLTLYNATLLKLHLTTSFTLPQCSENMGPWPN
jgi:hypothetical protein